MLEIKFVLKIEYDKSTFGLTSFKISLNKPILTKKNNETCNKPKIFLIRKISSKLRMFYYVITKKSGDLLILIIFFLDFKFKRLQDLSKKAFFNLIPLTFIYF